MDEKQIIKQLQNGESECYSQILAHYGTLVFTLIRRIIKNEKYAEELTQDVFIKVYNNIKKWRGECALSTWIYRVAYNTAISATRHRRSIVEVRGVEIDAASTPEYDPEREAQFAALENAITKLDIKERALVNLYYYDNKSIDELAFISGLTPCNVKVKLYRIRKKLYQNLL